VFNDGTSYTVKQDSLIVIEENSANDQQQPILRGGEYGNGRPVHGHIRSGFEVAGDVECNASLAPESAAQVHNDPKVTITRS